MQTIWHMSFETWTSILLAALAVLLAVVTLIVALAGIIIAVVGIWGIKEIKIAAVRTAEKAAREAFDKAIEQYPQGAEFFELYRNLNAQLSEFKREYAVWQKRSEEADAILTRLHANGNPDASNRQGGEDSEGSADTGTEPISASYPSGDGG